MQRSRFTEFLNCPIGSETGPRLIKVAQEEALLTLQRAINTSFEKKTKSLRKEAREVEEDLLLLHLWITSLSMSPFLINKESILRGAVPKVVEEAQEVAEIIQFNKLLGQLGTQMEKWTFSNRRDIKSSPGSQLSSTKEWSTIKRCYVGPSKLEKLSKER